MPLFSIPSTAPPLPALSNIPFTTLKRGQSPPHMTGDGGMRIDEVFPSGSTGTLSPSSVASISTRSLTSPRLVHLSKPFISTGVKLHAAASLMSDGGGTTS
ncbi:hypothetical protein BRARA_D01323 [Brassica rapa]|uniref:Uncharacterized protein n=1 Tax=Brassica campestris TaxID=3711 RepID=A0A397ZKK8_BRACM|nr:hypothetical protein BRARA_D01323 [Brassica rapa]